MGSGRGKSVDAAEAITRPALVANSLDWVKASDSQKIGLPKASKVPDRKEAARITLGVVFPTPLTG